MEVTENSDHCIGVGPGVPDRFLCPQRHLLVHAVNETAGRWRYVTEDLIFPYHRDRVMLMCRNIRTLFNFDPPVTEDEIRAASLQFVRKISGFTKPSKANEAAFAAAIDEVSGASARLLRSLETTAPRKNREEEAAKAKARAAERFGA